MSNYFLFLHNARQRHSNGDFEGASALCEQAIAENPEDARAYTQHAINLSELGLFDQACAAYAKAQSLEPDNPSLIDNYANVLKQMGRFDEAMALVEEALAIDKYYAPAFYTWSSLKKFSADDPDIGQFDALKKKTAGNAVFQSLICFSLGKIYDDLGEWDRAFENYAQGNDLSKEPYDKSSASKEYDAVKRVFTKELMDKFAGAGDPSQKPVFLVGMPRSGSSLIEDILSRNKAIHGLGERPEIAKLAAYLEHTHQQFPPFPDLLLNVNNATLGQFGGLYLQAVSKTAPQAQRFVDKNLLNFAYVGFIKLILRNAQIINTTRDPIDTCLSCYFQNFTQGHKYSFELESLARRYAAYDKLRNHWNELFGEDILTASYERMVADKDAVIAELFGHINMSPPVADVLEKPADRAIPTASAWQARQPIYKTSVKRWKNYEKHLGPLFTELEEAGVVYDGVG